MSSNVAFLFSTGRTGSIFLKDLLRRHTQVNVSESKPNFRRESLRYLQWKNGTFRKTRFRAFLPLGWYYRWKFKLSRMLPMLDGRVFLEINNYTFPMLPEIRRAFPFARVILLVRDPRTFLPSALNRGWFVNPHDYRMTGTHTGEIPRSEWQEKTGVQKLAWYWLRTNAMIFQARPDLVIRFEDIFGEHHEGLRKLLEVLEVSSDFITEEVFGQKRNSTSQFYVPRWEDWKPAWRQEAREVFRLAKGDPEISRLYPSLLEEG
jgi:hypothetical protein